MGKYSHLKDKLVRFQEATSDWTKLVDQRKAELDTNTTSELTDLLIVKKQLKTELEAQITKLNADIEAAGQLLVTRLEDDGLTKISMAGGPTLSILDSIYTSIVDRRAFFQWIKDTKQTDLLSVNHQTLKSVVAEMLLDGKDTPPGVKVSMKSSISVRSKELKGEPKTKEAGQGE